MNHSGEAAEQIVRMSLEGVEVAAKITGTAAKEIALFLAAALKNNEKNLKLKGKTRLASMLKSGKPLEIFSLKERDLAKFAQGAKQYGIVYCVLRNKKSSPDGLCDVMVKADDAPKISRLIERFRFATVDKAKIESELVAERDGRAVDVKAGTAPVAGQGAEPQAPELDGIEKLPDELLGKREGKAAPDKPETAKTEPVKTEPKKDTPVKGGPLLSDPIKGEPATATKGANDSRPFPGNGQTPLPSGYSSGSSGKPARITSSKPSVKEELREIKEARKAKKAETPKPEARMATNKSPAITAHKQPQPGKTKKQKRGR